MWSPSDPGTRSMMAVFTKIRHVNDEGQMGGHLLVGHRGSQHPAGRRNTGACQESSLGHTHQVDPPAHRQPGLGACGNLWGRTAQEERLQGRSETQGEEMEKQ